MFWIFLIIGIIAFCVHCASDPVNTAGSTKPKSRKKHRDNRGPYVASDGRVYDKKETPEEYDARKRREELKWEKLERERKREEKRRINEAKNRKQNKTFTAKKTSSRVSPALEGVFDDGGFQNQKVKVK
ncbi:hypothetical protein [Dethiosulfovibrio salsuginis]|uniref:Uncharacterized protein n=1 Tax=Dethiosulfovibrio salsuginis TaxID=561720 RepID=A0A1X7KUQ0_9BACT|nr:hypothetical protein [Dethiosulfovibrio salsuginis]SMG45207.1 hypothetical protein SAMN06275492_13712 [Dethiosulfovibrio salsuginis]